MLWHWFCPNQKISPILFSSLYSNDFFCWCQKTVFIFWSVTYRKNQTICLLFTLFKNSVCLSLCLWLSQVFFESLGKGLSIKPLLVESAQTLTKTTLPEQVQENQTLEQILVEVDWQETSQLYGYVRIFVSDPVFWPHIQLGLRNLISITNDLHTFHFCHWVSSFVIVT